MTPVNDCTALVKAFSDWLSWSHKSVETDVSQFFAIYSSCIFRLGITNHWTTMTLHMVNEMTSIQYTELRQIHQNHNDWLAYFASVRKFDDAPPALVSRELKQLRRQRQQKPHKFAYLTMKNIIFARFARAFFIFWHFALTFSFFLRREMTCFAVVCNDVSIWWQMFKLTYVSTRKRHQLYDWHSAVASLC